MPGFIGGSSAGSGGAGGEITFPKEFVDPVTKLRISQPENLIDTDFEYGLQPTKWETVELINNTPSFFSKSGDTTIPGIISITTNAGTREITVRTALEHGLAIGIPINVTGTKSVTADGSYIINSIPNGTTFTYLCRDNQPGNNSIEDLYTSIITGEFFQGSQLRIADAEGIVTDGEAISTLTVTTESTHGFGTNTPFYFLNLNSTISQEFEAANTAAKSFDSSNSATAQTFDGSNTLTQVQIDYSNSAVVGGTVSPIVSVDTAGDTITVTHTSESFQNRPLGTPLYYDVVTSSGYFSTNPRGVVFLASTDQLAQGTSVFQVSTVPDGTAIDIQAQMSGTFQLANQARTFAGNNVNSDTESTITILNETPQEFDGANDGSSGAPTGRSVTVSGYSGTSISGVADDGTLDWYQGTMLKYETTGAAASGLVDGNTYFVDSVFQSGVTTTYVFTIKELPDSPSVITTSGGSGDQTFTKIGVSVDKNIWHVYNHGFTDKDMLYYEYPVAGEANRGGYTSRYMFVERVYDPHNVKLSDSFGGLNYFGDGSNGAVTLTSNTSIAPTSTNGAYDGDMVVLNYESLTINSGVTLTTTQPTRGLLIYVQGDCTINGTISMTARGAAANPTVAGASDGNAVSTAGLRLPFITAAGTSTLESSPALLDGCGNVARGAAALHPSISGNGSVLTIPRVGATGAAAVGCGTGYARNFPANGTNGQTGGGGGGGRSTGGMYAGVQRGGVGSCFSGGAGSGGSAHAGANNCSSPGEQGADYGGRGGRGTGYTGSGSGNGHTAGGGAGNPGGGGSGTVGGANGFGVGNARPVGNTGGSGTGGLIILVVGGTLRINAGGALRAQGSNGGNKSRNEDGSGGGGSGGGSINLVYRDGYVNSGTISVAGGGGGSGNAPGSPGGTGSIQTLQVI